MQRDDTQPAPVTILLVEDQLSHTALGKHSVVHHRLVHQLSHVTDGQAALASLFRRGAYADLAVSPRPHVILLDLRRPTLRGFAGLQEIKASDALRPIPVVILTPSTAAGDVLRAYAQHATRYRIKPVGCATFAALRQELGMYWLGRNDDPRS